jgi:ABC-type lipoprotein release transport system permease subunit
MKIFLTMAWRNIHRNLRRTLITLGAICFGLASVIIFFGFTDGFHSQWVENTVKAYSGHIVVHRSGFRDDPQIGNSIEDLESVIARVEREETLSTYTTRVVIPALASTAENSSSVFVRGIDTKRESGVTALDERVIEGEYLKKGVKGKILLGHRLAKRLNARLGEKIVLMVQAADGSIGAELYRLAGIFRMGSIELDATLAVITIEDARELAVLGNGRGKATGVAVIVEKPDDVFPATARLKEQLEPLGYEVLPWQEVMPALSEMIDLDNVFMYIILIIVLVVVSLGILNTMLMSIMERTREFGVMMALGTKPAEMVRLVMLESFLLGLMGCVLGLGIGCGANALMAINGVDLSKWAGAMELMATLNPVVYPETHMGSVLWSSAAIFITAILVSVYPAVKASRFNPVDAIHFV